MKSSKTGGPGRRSEKPQGPRTIDLKASEVSGNKEDSPKPAPDPGGKAQQSTAQKEAVPKKTAPKATQTPPADKKTESTRHASPSGSPNSSKKTDPVSHGFGTLALAALFGGVIALGGMGLLTQAGLFGGDESGEPVVSVTESDLTALRQTLQSDITRLEESISGFSSDSVQADASEAVQSLSGRIDTIQQDLQALAGDSNAAPQIAALVKRLEGVESRLVEFGNRPENPSGSTAQELSALESKVDSIAQQSETTDTQIVALEKRMDALEKTAAEIPKAAAEVERLRTQQADANEKLARTVTANALRAALRNGSSLGEPLDSAVSIVGENEDSQKLRELDAAGYTSPEQLQSQFPAVSAAILEASARPEDEGMVSKLFSNAKSLVRVRPDGPQEGDGVEAIVSRIEADLNKGDLSGAYSEWEKLPAAEQAVSRDWAEQLQQRSQVDILVDKIAGRLTAGEKEQG